MAGEPEGDRSMQQRNTRQPIAKNDDINLIELVIATEVFVGASTPLVVVQVQVSSYPKIWLWQARLARNFEQTYYCPLNFNLTFGTGCSKFGRTERCESSGESSKIVDNTFLAIVLPILMHVIWICDCPRQQQVTSHHIENWQL
jgi:hypothetical protein